MTLSNRLPPIRFHPILWLFLLTAALTGMLAEIVILFSIVLIHELGHYFAARHYRWRIRRVMLWVFGGVMETDEQGTRPIKEELWVVCAGPLMHVLLYPLILLLSAFSVLPESMVEVALMYNTTILLFNLLPIWPLDGGKLIGLAVSGHYPYRKSYTCMLLISHTAAACLLLYVLFLPPFTLSTVCLTGFLIWENRSEWRRRFYVFLRFLLNRHTFGPPAAPVSYIHASSNASLLHVFSQFRRNRRHVIIVVDNEEKLDEKNCSKMYFTDKKPRASLTDVINEKRK